MKKPRKKAPAPRPLAYFTPLIFALLAPGLFMLVDMAVEQATQSPGLTLARLWSWISADGFSLLRWVYLVGFIPAALAGLLVARRDQRGGATPLFALAVFVPFALPVAVLFARNLFVFAPPPFGEQIAIGLRVLASVVIAGFLCYAITRSYARGGR